MSPEQIREERIKLFASYLNILAAGCGVGGIVTAPLAAITRNAPASFTVFVIYQVFIFVLSVSLHVIAQSALRRL